MQNPSQSLIERVASQILERHAGPPESLPYTSNDPYANPFQNIHSNPDIYTKPSLPLLAPTFPSLPPFFTPFPLWIGLSIQACVCVCVQLSTRVKLLPPPSPSRLRKRTKGLALRPLPLGLAPSTRPVRRRPPLPRLVMVSLSGCFKGEGQGGGWRQTDGGGVREGRGGGGR